jgi:hypothetical protein
MRKQHSLNNVISILIFTIIAFTSSLLSMDCPVSLIREIMIHEIIPSLAHDDICSLALVNKDYNKIIKNTIELRKNYLKNYLLLEHIPVIDRTMIFDKHEFNVIENKITYVKNYVLAKDIKIADSNITWHNNGSAFTLTRCTSYTCHGLRFLLVFLGDQGAVVETSYCENTNTNIYQWSNGEERPRFNDKGEAYFYGITEGEDFFEYFLSTKKPQKKLLCLIDPLENIRLDLRIKSLASLVNFPNLLSAILQSKQVHEEALKFYWSYRNFDENYKGKIYVINGVIIPDDYAVCENFRNNKFLSCKKINKFDDLDYSVKWAIERRYKEQQCTSVLEYLPKIIIEQIGSLIKRVGRDAFRCISKACNEIMWSQNELNNRLIAASMQPDEDKPFYKQCGGWKHPFFELQDVLQNSKVTLALVQWFINKWSLNDLQHEYLFFCAKNNKHYEIANWLYDYRKK